MASNLLFNKKNKIKKKVLGSLSIENINKQKNFISIKRGEIPQFPCLSLLLYLKICLIYQWLSIYEEHHKQKP